MRWRRKKKKKESFDAGCNKHMASLQHANNRVMSSERIIIGGHERDTQIAAADAASQDMEPWKLFAAAVRKDDLSEPKHVISQPLCKRPHVKVALSFSFLLRCIYIYIYCCLWDYTVNRARRCLYRGNVHVYVNSCGCSATRIMLTNMT